MMIVKFGRYTVSFALLFGIAIAGGSGCSGQGTSIEAEAEDEYVEPYDLETDADGDLIPEGFKAAYDSIVSLSQAGESTDAALEEFAEKLPYSDEVMQLQLDALELQEELAALPEGSDDEEDRLEQEIAEKQDAMWDDSDYAMINLMLERLADEEDGITESSDDSGDADSVEASVSASEADWRQLRRGDIMLINSRGSSAVYPYVWRYSHAGIYDGTDANGDAWVYESGPHGVQRQPLSKWNEDGSAIAFGRSKKSSEQDVLAALDWAKSKWGTTGTTAYNWLIPLKTIDSSLYCSQLVWKIHDHLGVDTDSNSILYFLAVTAKNYTALFRGEFIRAAATAGIQLVAGPLLIPTVLVPAVAPDELARSSDLDFYQTSTVGGSVTPATGVTASPEEVAGWRPGDPVRFTIAGGSGPHGERLRYHLQWQFDFGLGWAGMQYRTTSDPVVEIQIPKNKNLMRYKYVQKMRLRVVVQEVGSPLHSPAYTKTFTRSW